MNPTPTANPDAKLVTECLQECPALATPARNWPTSKPLDLKLVRGSGWGAVAVDKEEDHPREREVTDVLFDEGREESNVPPSSRVWLPGLTDHGGGLIGQGQQTSVDEDTSTLDLVGSCTLPSLRQLGLDIYVEKRN